MYGTLADVAWDQCIETPVAENLMVGLGIGLALESFLPVVCFERHDFLLSALDGLVNHLDKLPIISGGQFKLPVLVRAIVGANSPLLVGEQHKQNYCAELTSMLKYTDVVNSRLMPIEHAFTQLGKSPSGAVVLVEYRQDYELPYDESYYGDGVLNTP